MKNKFNFQNPFIIFLPFLVIYIFYILITHNDTFWGDENRYFELATNILNGYYSESYPKILLDKGPGYPLFLVPFIAFKVPLLYLRLLNAFFLYFSIIVLLKSLTKFVSKKLAYFISAFWGMYLNSFDNLNLIISETFAVFLVTLIAYNLIVIFENKTSKSSLRIILAGFLLGYLALTKFIFGYVITFLLVVIFFIYIFKRRTNFKKAFILLLIAFLTTIPYLIYTYNLTNRIYYWGNLGGNNLYWMSTPFENEYGDWIRWTSIKDTTEENYNELLYQQHIKDYNNIMKLEGLERDDKFKQIATHNILNNPIKFIKNCFSNIGRILFNYPYSYTLQKPSTLLRIPFNGILAILSLYATFITLINFKRIKFVFKILLSICLLYLSGSIIGSAETRMFTVIVPILLIWIVYIVSKSVTINTHLE